RELLFALPAGVPNDKSLKLSLSYAVRLHGSFQSVAGWGLFLSLLMFVRKFYRFVRVRQAEVADEIAPVWAETTPPWKSRVASFVPVFFLLLSYAMIATCIVYVASILYGLFRGYALPTATTFSLAPPWLSVSLEPIVPLVILTVAGVGACLSWLGYWRVLPKDPIDRTHASLKRLYLWWGLPVIVCLLLWSLSAGGWSGHFRPFDLNYF